MGANRLNNNQRVWVHCKSIRWANAVVGCRGSGRRPCVWCRTVSTRPSAARGFECTCVAVHASAHPICVKRFSSVACKYTRFWVIRVGNVKRRVACASCARNRRWWRCFKLIARLTGRWPCYQFEISCGARATLSITCAARTSIPFVALTSCD